jgi:hypothetical protein
LVIGNLFWTVSNIVKRAMKLEGIFGVS